MNNFVTIFEISKTDTSTLDDWSTLLVFGILVLGISATGLIVLLVRSRKYGWRGRPLFKLLLFMAVGLFLIVDSVQSLKAAEERLENLVSTYRENKCDIIEGVVHVLHEQPHTGHTKGDIVRIGNVEFEVNAWRNTPAYSLTIAFGGVLKDGVFARVYHDEGKILRVDIRKTVDANNPD